MILKCLVEWTLIQHTVALGHILQDAIRAVTATNSDLESEV